MQNLQQAGQGSPLTITFISTPTEHKTCCASIQTGHLDHHHHLRTWSNLVVPLSTPIPITIKSITTIISNYHTIISNQVLLLHHSQIRILLSHHYQTWLRIWSNSSQVEEKNGSLGSLLNGTRPENGLFQDFRSHCVF